jgi:hypothetical protein
MKPGFIYQFILCGILILTTDLISAQILENTDRDILMSRSKSILIVRPCANGAFYLNDFYLTDISANDTVYIYNIVPGHYTVMFATDSSSASGDLAFGNGKVLAIKPCNDSINLLKDKLYWGETKSVMQGRRDFRPRRAHFYNITQVGSITWNLKSHENSVLPSITTINGYQFAPGFCLGLGISYNNYPFDFLVFYNNNYFEKDLEDGNVHFLPVYLDLRMYFPPYSAKVAPFLKIDLGANILLKESQFHAADPTYNVAVTMEKGGVFFSPGIGLRIVINELVQITPLFEYSFENSGYYYNYDKYTISKIGLSSLKLSLGVSFQYK